MKKFIAGLIALLMVFGMIPVSAFAETDAFEHSTNFSALTLLEEQNNGILQDDDRATFIIEINSEGDRRVETSAYSTRSKMEDNEAFVSAFVEAREEDNLENLVEQRIEEQNNVLYQITGQNLSRNTGLFSGFRNAVVSLFSNRDSRPVSRKIDLGDIRRYKAVLNGFALDLTYAEAKEIAQLDSVKNVYISREYRRPEEAPLMKESRKLVNSNIANDRGYDGRGRVVAILDTGIDLRHQDLRLSEDGLKAARYSQTSIQKKIEELQLWGKFGTDKVPYIYNYADRTFTMMDQANHGHHIAGTIAGNGDEENGGVVGIVPDAQILAMRVFAVGDPMTNTSIYAEAIDDAALLGADAINMSLGSYAGSVEGADLIMIKAIKRANELGSIVAIAGGNDGFQMSNYDWQSSFMIDYATVGTPATMNESFAVASFNNNAYFKIPTRLSYNEKEAYINPGSAIDSALKTGFKLNTEYEFVDIGLGNKDDDYVGKDVTGKIALVQRGGDSFNNKAKKAGEHGAVAIVIGNNEPGKQHFSMSMDGGLIPAYFVHLDIYNDLKALEDKKLTILDKPNDVLSPNAGTMSNFNSWGPTPALTIKPEIAAPGGDIRSIDNNGGYTYMSGTSMATPHVVGGIAAVNGKLQDMDMNFSGVEKSTFIKKILMSTAKPQEVKDHEGKYYSVRSQGSGLMDLDAATNGNFVYLEDADNHSSKGEAKIELKQLNSNSLPVSVDVISKADKEVSYDVYAVIETDQVDERYKLNLNMAEYEPYMIMEKTKIGEITVPAMGRVNFNETLNFDDTEFRDRFPNGYYVDGFIFFEPKNQETAMEDEHFSKLSIPFLGFRGDWDDVPVIEPFIDELDKDGDRPFWAWRDFQKASDYYLASPFDLHATSFIAQQNDIINGRYLENILGRTWDGNFTDNIAISPNKDNNQDDMTFKGVFLRNWNDFRIEVTDDLGNKIKEIYVPYRSSGRKTAFTVNMENPVKSTTNDFWTWDGSDEKGTIVPEGDYNFNLKVRRADDKNAKVQTVTKKVIVDISKPRIESSTLDGNEIIVKAMDEGRVPSGIKDVFYIQNYLDGDKNKVELFRLEEADGQYVLDTRTVGANFNLETGYLKVLDWAGNSVEEDVAEAKGDASVEFVREFKDGSTEGLPTQVIDVYKVDMVNGKESYQLVEDQKALVNGKYIAEFRDIPTGYHYEWQPSNEFEIDDNNRHQVIRVKFEKEDKTGFANFTAKLVWPSDYPGQIKIIAVAEDGSKYQLERTRGWGGILFNAQIPAGQYEIQIVDQYGNSVNVEGNKHIEVNENDNLSESYQVVNYGAYLKVYFLGSNLLGYFGEDIEQIDGKYYLNDFSKYVKIINVNTGNDILDTLEDKSDFSANKPIITNGDEGEFDLNIPVPFGTYTIEWKGWGGKNADPQVLQVRAYTLDHSKNEWKEIELIDANGQVGNLTVKTGFVPGFEERNIDTLVTYTLVDSYGKVVKSTSDNQWENLSIGNYTLYPESSEPGLIPERESYPVVITENANEEVLVRWKDQKNDPVDRVGEVVVGIYGDGGSTLGIEKLNLVFNNLTNPGEEPKVFEYRKDQPEVMKFLLPFGEYEVTLEGLYDYTISEVFLSENDYNNAFVYDGNKFKTKVFKAWNEIEISLTRNIVLKHDKDLYEPQSMMIEKKVGDKITEKEIYETISIPGYSAFKGAPEFKLAGQLKEELTEAGTVSYKVHVVYPDKSVDEVIVWVNVREESGHVIVKPGYDHYHPNRPEKPIKEDKKRDLDKKEETKKETKVDPLDIPEIKMNVAFDDINETMYQSEIMDLASRGILKGMGEGKYEPNTGITRAMLVETLMRISRDKSVKEFNDFPDVKEEDWFFNSVNWAFERKIVIGNELGYFEPNRTLTRQEAALIFSRFLKTMGIELPEMNEFNLKDLTSIPEWSFKEVESMYKIGVVLGVGENYEPTSQFSRDELAHALYTIINKRK